GRVARVVPFEYLEDAEGILEALIPVDLAVRQRGAASAELMSSAAGLRARLPARDDARARRRGCLHAFVGPAGRVVCAGLRIEPGEETVQLIGVLEVLADDGRRVGVA